MITTVSLYDDEKLFFMSFIDLFFINGMRCYVTYYSC